MGERGRAIRGAATDLCQVLRDMAGGAGDPIQIQGRVACAIVMAAHDGGALERFVDLAARGVEADPAARRAAEALLVEFRRAWSRRPPRWRRDVIRLIREDRHKILMKLAREAGGVCQG